ncbi:Spermatogenesis-associated protein 7, or HSD3 [Popillia japonica]|uniref:Spermatogenesis-associated protein 7, or HSD3 n=1 Tax=Popillia japonica TaxID=7064 RepID=A0AAW1MCP4_POPJA
MKCLWLTGNIHLYTCFREVKEKRILGEYVHQNLSVKKNLILHDFVSVAVLRASSPVHTAMSAASKSVSSRSVSPPSRATSPVGMCISSTGKCISTGSPAVMYVPSSPNYVPPIPKYVSPSPKSVPPGSRNGLPAETKISLSNRAMPPTYRPISPTYIPISPTTTETGSLNTKALKNSVAEHEYLQFALRITEDILRNDLYTNTEIKRVFNSHIEANRGRLEEERMQQQIQELALELNLAYDDSSPIHYEIMCFTPESYKCECAEPQPEPELENDCTCGSVQSVPVSFNESKRSSKSSDGSDTDYETNRPEGKRRRHRRRKRSNDYTSRLREFAPVVPSTSMIMHLRSHLLHQSRGSLLEQFPYKNTSRLRDAVKSMKDKKKSTTSILSAKNGPTYQCTSCQCGGKDGPKSPEVATRDEGVPNIVHDSQVSRSTAKNIPGATPVKGRTSSKLSKVVSISQEVITEDTKKPLENKPSSESRNVIPLDSHKSNSHKSSESVKPEVPSSIVNSSQQSTQSTKKKKASPRALAKARAKASSKSSIKPKTEKDGKISASAILTKPSDSNMSTHNPSVDLSCIANKSKEVSIGSFKGKRTSRGQYKDRSKESFDGNRSERRRTIDSNRSDRKLYRQQRKRRSKSSVTSDSQMRGSIDSKSINSGEQPTQYHSKYSKNDDEESFMSQMQCSQIDKERKLKSSQEKLNTLHEVSSGEIKKKCTCATDNEEYFMSHMQCPRTCKAMLKRKLKISNEKSLKAETNKKCTCVKDETDTFLSRLQCPQTCNAMLKPSIVRDKLHEVTNNTNTIKQFGHNQRLIPL